MFDDMIFTKANSCADCGCTLFEYIGGDGYFISSKRFRQRVRCTKCGNEWWVILNEKLEIVN